MRRFPAQRLLPGPGDDIELVPRQIHGKGRRRRIANHQPLPVGSDEIRIRQPHARRGAVPGEHQIMRRINLGQVGQLAIRRAEHIGIGQLQLLDDVGRPGLGKTLKRQDIHRARPEQRPQRQFHGPGVGGRNNAKAPVIGHAKDGFGPGDHLGQPPLRGRGAMRAPKRVDRQRGERIARTLGTGARGKLRIIRTDVRHGKRHCSSPFQKRSTPVGECGPPPC